jgi:hypothetical protein
MLNGRDSGRIQQLTSRSSVATSLVDSAHREPARGHEVCNAGHAKPAHFNVDSRTLPIIPEPAIRFASTRDR